MDEQSVLNMLSVFNDLQHESGTHRKTLIELSNKLNHFVQQMALAQSELVDPNFILSYVSKVSMLRNKDFRFPVDKSLYKLCEEKLNQDDNFAQTTNQSVNEFIPAAPLMNDADMDRLAIKLFAKDVQNKPSTLTALTRILNRIKDETEKNEQRERIVEIIK